jgi:hypothetical protein
MTVDYGAAAVRYNSFKVIIDPGSGNWIMALYPDPMCGGFNSSSTGAAVNTCNNGAFILNGSIALTGWLVHTHVVLSPSPSTAPEPQVASPSQAPTNTPSAHPTKPPTASPSPAASSGHGLAIGLSITAVIVVLAVAAAVWYFKFYRRADYAQVQ